MKSSSRLYQCLVRFQNATFRADTRTTTPQVFKAPIEEFSVFKPNDQDDQDHSSFWAITGPRKTQFLQCIGGKYITSPPLARTYPFLKEKHSGFNDRVQLLNFREQSGLDKTYLLARYETFAFKGKLEMADDVNSVHNYVTGAYNYNNNNVVVNPQFEAYLFSLLNLNHLSNKWINLLSNGQMRRARIAKLLITRPELLVIDDPFLGLDPGATAMVSESLKRVASELQIGIVLGLRVQDDIPNWIDKVGYVDDEGLSVVDPSKFQSHSTGRTVLRHQHNKKENMVPTALKDTMSAKNNVPPHIQFDNASVVYRGLPVLLDFNWIVQPGSRWRILGDNGTGKTTILLLITADHPQSWKSVLSVNGKLRKSGTGVNFFDVNNNLGLSSPELHALVPPGKTMWQVILSGLVKDVGNSNFMFTGKENQLGHFGLSILQQFNDRLEKSKDTPFCQLSITDQKLALFLRAIVKNPQLLILDEAFSCMDEESVMERCHDIVNHQMHSTTVLSIGHLDWELVKLDYVLHLVGDDQRHYNYYKYT